MSRSFCVLGRVFIRRGEDMDGGEGALHQQRKDRPVGKDALHDFGIEWVPVPGEC